MTNIFKCGQCGEDTVEGPGHVHTYATCADQQQYELSLLKRQRDDLLFQVDKLLEQTKRLKCQLAGCGVAAMQNTRDSMTQRAAPGDYGYSASYEKVCLAVDREIALREQRDELLEALKYCRNKIAYMQAHGEWYSPGRAIEMADVAIAKATGDSV